MPDNYCSGYFPLIDVKCPVCGKEFCPTCEWAYRNSGGRRVCSYNCMMASRKTKKKSKRQSEREKYDEITREMLNKKASGMSTSEIAKEYGVHPTSVGMRITNYKKGL
jgi:DNA invertase Pin-like site-specific DNA recombinase